MKFCDKVKNLRKEIGISQELLAEKIGVSKRTVQNYETADMYPKSREIYKKLADTFSVDVNYLLTEDEKFISEAKNRYGRSGEIDAKELVGSISALFSGGQLPEEDKDAVMRAISDAYWTAKEENKKYASRK